MSDLTITPATTALLVMDCQEGMVGQLPAEEGQMLLANLRKVIDTARSASIAIIYVVVKFREGYPEVSPMNSVFRGVMAAGRLRDGAPDAEICDEIRPETADVVVVKKRISAFTGSDLEVLLHAKGIDTLILAGISTRGVVESTARSAADRDFRVIVLEDCCGDRDGEAHANTIKWVLPVVSTIHSSETFIDSLAHQKDGPKETGL